ncbi:MAG: 8-oxo-dGTP diphosphatase MutT [Porticoccaceae bacterium]|jgi:8-oxo-dGTP diphosphatase|tara:strand:- start:1486 stop:1902 length:417 start_codon:yes stop_codon:yes gene_type:complete
MKRIHVVAAVIYGNLNEILIARRPDHLHQGGLWEFPGGKIEANETTYQGLVRELNEELAIKVIAANPFMQVSHDYSDKHILLDVWQVTAFKGEARGAEGQECCWVPIKILLREDSKYAFPQANRPILDALATILHHRP